MRASAISMLKRTIFAEISLASTPWVFASAAYVSKNLRIDASLRLIHAGGWPVLIAICAINFAASSPIV